MDAIRNESSFYNYTAVHCILQSFAWSIIVPIAIFLTHHFYNRDDIWWPTMKWGGVLVLILNIAASVLMFLRNASTSSLIHSVFGYILVIAAIIQILFALFSPNKEPNQTRWKYSHFILGVLLSIGTTAFIIGGLGLISDWYGNNTWWVILVKVFSYIGFSILGITVVLIIINLLKKREIRPKNGFFGSENEKSPSTAP